MHGGVVTDGSVSQSAPVECVSNGKLFYIANVITNTFIDINHWHSLQFKQGIMLKDELIESWKVKSC